MTREPGRSCPRRCVEASGRGSEDALDDGTIGARTARPTGVMLTTRCNATTNETRPMADMVYAPFPGAEGAQRCHSTPPCARALVLCAGKKYAILFPAASASTGYSLHREIGLLLSMRGAVEDPASS